MALLFPIQLPETGIPESERLTWCSCTRLDNQWRVFHSVKWQSVRRGRQGDGEADFILFHPNYGIIVLEVKGGEIDVTDGKWHSTDSYANRHSIKNPFDQVRESKYGLLSYFRDTWDILVSIPVNYGVVFPSIRIDDGIGTFGPRAIILDKGDLEVFNSAVDRIVRHWE